MTGVVERLRVLLPEEHRPVVHYGAASQDILDTAMMIVAKEAARTIKVELRNCRLAAREVGTRFETEPHLWGRTLLQRAEPIALGDLVGMWDQVLSSAEAALEGLAFPASLAGPVGSSWGKPERRPPEADAPLEGGEQEATAEDTEFVESRPERALGLRERFALRLGLDVPSGSWHTDRSPVVRIGSAAAEAAGACGKVAVDIMLLSQNEIGEVAEARGGGSISMPHKHNPVAATAARACAARTPGLLSTLYAAMPQELQRSPGLWHSEWETLSDLLRLTGSAATWLRESIEDLRVDPDAMRRHLEQGPV
jgi:3-carboxy-cis,cis-muconate cycloisomerase